MLSLGPCPSFGAPSFSLPVDFMTVALKWLEAKGNADVDLLLKQYTVKDFNLTALTVDRGPATPAKASAPAVAPEAQPPTAAAGAPAPTTATGAAAPATATEAAVPAIATEAAA